MLLQKYYKQRQSIFLSVIIFFLIIALLWICDNTNKEYSKMTFREKVEAGYTPRILIVGDSIGGNLTENEWCMKLKQQLDDANISVEMDNVSLGGNTVFAGYSQLARYDKHVDLLIFCFGQNDADNEDFPLMYENMIRLAKEKYPYAEEIAILESSQREYTNKIQTIISLCDYYSIPYADMILTYSSSGKSYEDLTLSDGIHPNNAGKQLYANTLFSLIKEEILQHAKKRFSFLSLFNSNSYPEPLNTNTRKASHYKYIPKEDMISNGLTLSTSINDEYMYVGAEAMFVKGEHEIIGKLSDGTKFYLTYIWEFESQHHIYKGYNERSISGEITLTFDSQETMDKFYGIILCN